MAKKSSKMSGTEHPIKGKLKRPTPRKRESANGQVEVVVIEQKPPSPLRGILPTPPEVEAFVEEVLKDRPASPAARQRITDDFKMQYYFGGHPVAHRRTDQGIEVLAVGWEEIKSLKRKRMSQAERLSIITGWWDPW